MPAFYATVTCPACGTRFQTPVEQVLDVRVDPQVKGRVLNGSVNIAICPSCGTGGKLNLPFLYHDPENEVALLYLPMEVGKTEIERQKHAGTLTQQLMNSLAPEERKGYLLQPETFINMESFTRRLLEIEGISEDDMQRTKEQQQFMEQLLQAEPEAWAGLLEEHAALIDESFFALLDYLLRMAASAGPENADFKRMQDLVEFVTEQHPLGQVLKQRSDVVRIFVDNPTRETLVQALVAAADDGTVDYLVRSGLPVMDYAFFQALLKQIEAATTPEEKERLTAIRRRILEVRDQVTQEGEALAQERFAFLQRLLESEDPLKMARSHLSELDDIFFLVLRNEMEQAQQQGEQEYVEALQGIVGLVTQLQEENMPPEVAFVRRLLMAPSDEKLTAMLEKKRKLLQPAFLELLGALEQNAREEGHAEVAERLAQIRAKAQTYVSGSDTMPAQPQATRSTSGEEKTASGLIIAKH